MSPWDIAAPRLVVEEAGGRFTEEPGLYLSSNGVLHDEIRALLLPA
jgi:3'-phosphoadenosine 5'-phosphosulfate (PAPS) 3'-phosphatase